MKRFFKPYFGFLKTDSLSWLMRCHGWGSNCIIGRYWLSLSFPAMVREKSNEINLSSFVWKLYQWLLKRRNNDKLIVSGKFTWWQFSEWFHKIFSTFKAVILMGVLLCGVKHKLRSEWIRVLPFESEAFKWIRWVERVNGAKKERQL